MKSDLLKRTMSARTRLIENTKALIEKKLVEAADQGQYGAHFVRERYSYSGSYPCFTLPNIRGEEIVALCKDLEEEHGLKTDYIQETFDGHRGAVTHIRHGFTVTWE